MINITMVVPIRKRPENIGSATLTVLLMIPFIVSLGDFIALVL